MECPNCGGAMYDNRNNKLNPKAPDFKCKNKDCIDPQSGRTSAVWLKRTQPAPAPQYQQPQYDQYGNPIQAAPAPRPAPAQRPQAARPAPVPGAADASKERTMVMAYAKDLVVAQIAGGQVVDAPVKSIIMAYRLLLKEVKAPGSVIFKGDQEAPALQPDPSTDELNDTFPPDEDGGQG